MSTSSLILQALQLTEEKNKRSYKTQVKELLTFNKQFKGSDFLRPLNYYLNSLENQDIVLLPFMNEEQQKALMRELQITLLLLLAQRNFELTHQKTENKKKYTQHIKKCHQLMQFLQEKERNAQAEIQIAPHLGSATPGYPVKYLALDWGRWFAESTVDIMDRKTKSLKEHMGAFNGKRLYWVWGSSLLKSILEILPSDTSNLDSAKSSIRTPDPYTGVISWALYYFRFSLDLSLLLKHTIKGPWMDAEEQQTPWTQRFITQWNQRKFTLLNDSVWATGNLLCFFWLTGAGTLGAWGDALTLALLIFDITLTVWEFSEEQTKYNKEIEGYEKDIQKLNQKMALLKKQAAEDTEKQKKELEYQISVLQGARMKCERQWQAKKIDLIINISYAVGLMISFFLLATPFIPALAYLAPVGAVLCFTVSLINNAIKGGIEVHRAKQNLKDIYKDLKDLKKQSPSLPNDSKEKKLIFLKINQLMAQSEQEEKNVQLQIAHLVRSIIIDMIIPAIILVNLIFFPVALVPAICATLALAACSHLIINQLFKSKKEELEPFDEHQYQLFCKDPEHFSKKSPPKPSFFNSSKNSKEPVITAEEILELKKLF